MARPPEWEKLIMNAPDQVMARHGDAYLDGIRRELKRGRRQWRRGDNLLAAFGYTRRRQTAIDLINAGLKAKGLYTDPTLTTEMPLDHGITFYLKGKRSKREALAPPDLSDAAEVDIPVEVVELASDDDERHDDETATVTIPLEPPIVDVGDGAARALRHIVGNLECAERVPEQIKPTATIGEALTIMDLRDYSQLVVTTSSRDVKGIISYKSVARAYLHGTPTTVRHCIDTTVPRVERGEPLLKVVERFKEHDAVLIMAVDKTLAGIVTPADIAVEFGAMAAPFLLIGQIEDQLRWLVQTKLPDLGAALDVVGRAPDGGAEPPVSELTMGELHRVLDHADNWSQVGIKYDRGAFCKELDAVREIRNAVMHFRDHPDDVVERLKRFANVVQEAYLQSGK